MEPKAQAGGVAADVRHALLGSLRRRSTESGSTARRMEDALKRSGGRLLVHLKRHPWLGIVAAGAGGVAIASAIGVGEVAIGVAVAYGVYEILVRGEPPEKVAEILAREIEEV